MTKNVWVTVAGLQFGDNPDGDRVEILTPGSYYRKKDHHYVLYDEVVEGSEEVTRNIVRFKEDAVTISKSGFTNAEMVFEKNKKSMTNYVTPYGSLVVGIDADRVDVSEKEDLIHININYALDVNYEHLADCEIMMDIVPYAKLTDSQ